ncbi:MAG: hypothetical protein ACPGYK_10115 [Flavobacteriales bacterium]
MNKSLFRTLIITATVLLITAIGSLISGKTDRNRSDCIMGGTLLMTVIAGLGIVIHRVKGALRWVLLLVVVLAFVLVWAELAVGIFGTPFAGS